MKPFCLVGLFLVEAMWMGAIWRAPHPTPAQIAALPPSGTRGF